MAITLRIKELIVDAKERHSEKETEIILFSLSTR